MYSNKLCVSLLYLGRELAVKIVDINHIDHAAPSTDSLNMQKVSCFVKSWWSAMKTMKIFCPKIRCSISLAIYRIPQT